MQTIDIEVHTTDGVVTRPMVFSRTATKNELADHFGVYLTEVEAKNGGTIIAGYFLDEELTYEVDLTSYDVTLQDIEDWDDEYPIALVIDAVEDQARAEDAIETVKETAQKAAAHDVAPTAREASYQAAKSKTNDRVLRPGLYRHYEGDFFTVIMPVKSAHTGNQMVVYLTPDGQPMVTGKSYFLGTVPVDGDYVERFSYMGEHMGTSA